MAFFTRVNLNVPVLPPEDSMTESVVSVSSSASTILHRRHVSEPANVQSILDGGKFGVHHSSAQNCLPLSPINGSSNARTNSVTQTSAVIKNVGSTIINGESATNITAETKNVNITVSLRDRSCTTVPESESEQMNENPKSDEASGEEPKRYEYVVDRILGVEV